MQIFAIISKNIEDLKALIRSNDLVTKMQLTEELATNCYYLSEVVADAYETSSMAEFLYKSSLSSSISESTEGVAKSEHKAKTEYKKLHQEWIVADALYKRGQLLLNAANTVIEQNRQTVSYLKQEYQREHGR